MHTHTHREKPETGKSPKPQIGSEVLDRES